MVVQKSTKNSNFDIYQFEVKEAFKQKCFKMHLRSIFILTMPSQVFLAFSASLSPPNLPNPPVSSHLGRELWIKERSVSRCDTHLCQSSADFESRLFRKHFLSTKGPLTDVMLCALMFRNVTPCCVRKNMFI